MEDLNVDGRWVLKIRRGLLDSKLIFQAANVLQHTLKWIWVW
jgi:hypothetical protein